MDLANEIQPGDNQLHESKIVSLSCDAAVSYRAPLAFVGDRNLSMHGKNDTNDPPPLRELDGRVQFPTHLDLLHYYAGSERPMAEGDVAGSTVLSGHEAEF